MGLHDNTQACRFCAAGRGGASEGYDLPLFESQNFFVVPSLGGFVEGWLLVVTRDHLLNLRQVSEDLRPELHDLVSVATAALVERYGDVVKFEHGPANCGSPAGCSIDHAHLHVVPCREPLRASIEEESAFPIQLRQVDGLFADVSADRGDSYLFLEEADGAAYLGFASSMQSQLVRRVLARKVGLGSRFDWREDYALETVSRTRSVLVPT